jgi:hypothetical protein
MEGLFPGWEATWRHVGWPFFAPFALQAARAAGVSLLLLGIARNHPRRELLILATLLFGLMTDLLDGIIARTLRMTGLQTLSWGDLAGDLGFWVGALVIVRFRRSLAKDVPPLPAGTFKARGVTRGEVFWIAVIVVQAGLVASFIMHRALSIRWR